MLSAFRDKLRSVAEVIVFGLLLLHMFFVDAFVFSIGNLEFCTKNDADPVYKSMFSLPEMWAIA